MIQRQELYEAAIEAHRRHDFMRAGSLYSQFVKLNPDFVPAWENLGLVLAAVGNRAGAEECWLGILRFKADYPDLYRVHAHLCWLLNVMGKPTAIEHGEACVRINPGFAEGWLNLAGAYDRESRHEDALACAEKARDLGGTRAYQILYSLKRFVCDWDGLDEVAAKLEEFDDGFGFNFYHLGIPGTSAEKQLAQITKFARQFPPRYLHQPGVRPDVAGRRIRLGYVGNEFHETPTMLCLASTFEHHDRQRFELHAYSLGPDRDDPMRQRLKRSFEHFHDVAGMPSDEIARRIAAEGIDILVDLSGYIQNNRAEIMARRSAPVQVSMVGWPATMGAPFMDYLVADPVVAPDARWFSETLLRLDCYLPTDDTRPDPVATPRAELGLPENALVIAAMNNSWKITPQVMAVWCHILKEVPEAVLWLPARHPLVERNLRAFAEKAGVGERLIFAGAVPYEAHLGRIASADLALDTFPYGGHSTTSDLLRAGVPVVTCRGDSFASRVATSLLHAVGVPELSADSLERYRDLALALCRDRTRLAGLKERVIAARRSSPLFDNLGYTRALEREFAALLAPAP